MSLLDTLEAGAPNRPEPGDMALAAATTGIAVLDMSARAEEPGTIANKLLPGLGPFLERARQSRVPIIYTISLVAKDGPHDRIAGPLKRAEAEPVIYPDSFDKFIGGELNGYLRSNGVERLIVLGGGYHLRCPLHCHHRRAGPPVRGGGPHGRRPWPPPAMNRSTASTR